MKHTLLTFALLFISFFVMQAQNNESLQNSESLEIGIESQIEPQIDSSYYGINIFSLVSHSADDEGVVKINQSSDVSKAMERYIANNKTKKISGWRVRIYFDNAQNSRVQSENIARSFAAEYPRIRVYRSHVSPYFKVTVGDFRTKFEAQQFSNKIKGQYPSVFLVRENINYPSL